MMIDHEVTDLLTLPSESAILETLASGAEGVALLRCDGWPDGAQGIGSVLRHSPVPTVLMGEPGKVPPWLEASVDVCLTDVPSPRRPWVRAPAESVLEGIQRQPLAAMALVTLLRSTERSDVWSAVCAESATFAMLLGSSGFHDWLQGRIRNRRGDHWSPDVVALSRSEDQLSIELNRPAVRNAVNSALRDALVEGLSLAEADHGIARIVITGRGPSFCSGGDLGEFGTTTDPVTTLAVRLQRHPGLAVQRVSDRVEARLHGACVGAGVEIPAFAGTVTAAANTTFCLPELSMGLIPGAGGTVSVKRRIGRQRTAWFALSGATIDVEMAQSWGLVDAIAE